MSVVKILRYGDEKLRTPSKEVHKVSSKVKKIIKNLIDTMYAENGVGLAAPQIGENIRAFIIDVGVNGEPANPIVFINPKIIEKTGAVNSFEGCLSFPDAFINTRRYANVKIKALDKNGKPFVMEANEGSLLAIAMQHENDHLDGILLVDHSRNRFETDQILAEKDLPPIDTNYLQEEAELEEEIKNSPQLEESNVQN
ncbi:MAG: peptide deformylase [Candidatus Gastranaerophilales bacterium]|nr:peptide deformylase [Candidatus Gastranaerophilales bacterium]